jgi:hypothetical protein
MHSPPERKSVEQDPSAKTTDIVKFIHENWSHKIYVASSNCYIKVEAKHLFMFDSNTKRKDTLVAMNFCGRDALIESIYSRLIF